jgi:hypothetical protein
MVLNSMAEFAHMLNVPLRRRGGGPEKRRPLIRIILSLSAPDIVMFPQFSDVTKLFVNRVVDNILQSTQRFVRWMKNTCIECPPVPAASADAEPTIVSFLNDVSANPHVTKLIAVIDRSMRGTHDRIRRYMRSWRDKDAADRYHKNEKLWNTEKVLVIDKMAQQKLNFAAFDTVLAHYRMTAMHVARRPQEEDIDFVRVAAQPLAGAIENLARAWMTAIGMAAVRGMCLVWL